MAGQVGRRPVGRPAAGGQSARSAADTAVPFGSSDRVTDENWPEVRRPWVAVASASGLSHTGAGSSKTTSVGSDSAAG